MQAGNVFERMRNSIAGENQQSQREMIEPQGRLRDGIEEINDGFPVKRLPDLFETRRMGNGRIDKGR